METYIKLIFYIAISLQSSALRVRLCRAYEECVLLAGYIYQAYFMIEESGKNTILTVSVKPNSGEFAVDIKEDKLIVRLKNRAENNRANIELIKELRRILKKEVSLLSGGKSKTKKLVIYDATKSEIERAFGRR